METKLEISLCQYCGAPLNKISEVEEKSNGFETGNMTPFLESLNHVCEYLPCFRCGSKYLDITNSGTKIVCKDCGAKVVKMSKGMAKVEWNNRPRSEMLIFQYHNKKILEFLNDPENEKEIEEIIKNHNEKLFDKDLESRYRKYKMSLM